MKPIRLRFRIRTLLVVLTLLCLSMGPSSAYIYRAQVQRWTVFKLELQGASVHYQIERENFLTKWVCEEFGIDYVYPVTSVVLDHSTAEDPSIVTRDISRLRNFESIEITGVPLKNSDVERLASNRKLHTLQLQECILDDGPLHLLDNLQLTALNLRRTHVSDRSIRGLQNMQSLTYLNLDRTKVSDASVPLIRQLKNLKTLYIGHSKVTKEGALKIKRALPNCEVRWAPLSTTESIPDSAIVDE